MIQRIIDGFTVVVEDMAARLRYLDLRLAARRYQVVSEGLLRAHIAESLLIGQVRGKKGHITPDEWEFITDRIVAKTTLLYGDDEAWAPVSFAEVVASPGMEKGPLLFPVLPPGRYALMCLKEDQE